MGIAGAMKTKRLVAVEDSDEAATSSSEQEENEEELKGRGDKGKGKLATSSATITEYERQRQQRIDENRAKLQALRLPVLASSLSKNSDKKLKKPTSQKAKIKQDNDYQPSTEDEQSESSRDEDAEHKVPTPKKVTSAKRRPPGRPKSKKMKSLNSLIVDKASEEHGWTDLQENELDDDAALQQALALSMGASMEDATAIAEASKQDSEPGRPKEKVDNSELGGKTQETAKVDKLPRGRRQRKQTKSINAIQLSEDEVLAYFFLFDEAGKGKISMRDLERVALTHDFTWNKHELNEMINTFDNDCDGQLSLEDFQTIIARCNMIGGS